jgi:DNA-binding MltR family transcriptional regulator
MGIVLTGEEKRDSAEKHSLESLNRFLSVIGHQDDRAMVLSLAAFIEDTLGRLLLAYFRKCKATRALVEGFNAPLGTFSSRIKSVYAFGLVTEDQYRDMDVLRKVRNLFAHNWEGVSLERSDIQGMVGQISGYTVAQDEIKGGTREKLLGTLSTCCIELQVFVGRLETGKAVKAPDVSHRLATEKPTGYAYQRYVE